MIALSSLSLKNHFPSWKRSHFLSQLSQLDSEPNLRAPLDRMKCLSFYLPLFTIQILIYFNTSSSPSNMLSLSFFHFVLSWSVWTAFLACMCVIRGIVHSLPVLILIFIVRSTRQDSCMNFFVAQLFLSLLSLLSIQTIRRLHDACAFLFLVSASNMVWETFSSSSWIKVFSMSFILPSFLFFVYTHCAAKFFFFFCFCTRCWFKQIPGPFDWIENSNACVCRHLHN